MGSCLTYVKDKLEGRKLNTSLLPFISSSGGGSSKTYQKDPVFILLLGALQKRKKNYLRYIPTELFKELFEFLGGVLLSAKVIYKTFSGSNPFQITKAKSYYFREKLYEVSLVGALRKDVFKDDLPHAFKFCYMINKNRYDWSIQPLNFPVDNVVFILGDRPPGTVHIIQNFGNYHSNTIKVVDIVDAYDVLY